MDADITRMTRISIEDGKEIVAFARKAVEEWVRNNKTLREMPQPQIFGENRGIMLSINEHRSGSLRGRIGYPYPLKSVAEVLVRCAISACQDPRSPSLKPGDLDSVVIEVSVLSEPRLLAKPHWNKIDPEKEGIVVVRGAKHALTMPGDIPKNGNDAIAEIMKKAGINEPDGITKFYKFDAQTFLETAPSGEVAEKTVKPAKKSATAARLPTRKKNNKQFKHKKRDKV